MDVALPLLLLAALLLAGVPVSLSLLTSGFVGTYLVGGAGIALGIIRTEPFRETASYALITVPMFVLMAEFITKGRLAQDIFSSLQAWSGRVPGGAVVATVYAGAGLGAICGSSAAAASTMGKVAIPELRKLGYAAPFSVGAVAVAGTLAVMIPPSTVLLLYALLTDTSIGAMLLAGIVPGLFTATALALYVAFRARREVRSGTAHPGRAYSLREKLVSARSLWPFAVLILAVLGGIYTGVVSAIEASALGAACALVILAVLRRLTLRDVGDALRDTAHLSSMIFMIIVGAGIFGFFLTLARVPDQLADLMIDAGIGRWGILGLILLGIFVLGLFMDQIAIMSLTLPIVFPIVTGLGFDAIWFGIVFACLAEIGLVTPPLGLNVYVASAAGGETPETGFKGVWPFVLVMLGVLACLVAFPGLTQVFVPENLV